MRTPGNDFELALGFLFTEGIIQNTRDIAQINYCTELGNQEQQYNIVRVELKENIEFNMESVQRNFYTTSSCGICGKASIDAIKQQCDKQLFTQQTWLSTTIITLPELLRKHQLVFKHTGGLHACALFNQGNQLLLMREDVGRHNALDKLIGASLNSSEIAMSNSILLLSGRASFELIQKAAMAGIPIIAAVGAPSSLAVETAKEFGLTLIGFLRDDRFNVYCGAERVK